jgi:parvulin-like peptidyl-prolyl isomerase
MTPYPTTQLSFGRLLRKLVPAAAFLALFIAGCGLISTRKDEVIAEINGEPVLLSSFDDYVDSVMIGEPDQDEEAPSPELLSGLLDRYLEEELILRSALQRGIEISEKEVTEALRQLRQPNAAAIGLEAEKDYEQIRERMRRDLTTGKFRDERVLKGISVSSQEIAVYYDLHRNEFKQSARLVLRQILLQDSEKAKEVRRLLLKDKSKFQELAEEHSMAPDRGRPRSYESRDLPPEILEAVSGVEEGKISKVSSSAVGSQIFLLEKRDSEREMDIDEAGDRIHVVLLQKKGREAYNAMMTALREEAELIIHEEHIPFPYQRSDS